MVNTFENFEPKNVQNRLKLRKVMQSMCRDSKLNMREFTV